MGKLDKSGVLPLESRLIELATSQHTAVIDGGESNAGL